MEQTSTPKNSKIAVKSAATVKPKAAKPAVKRAMPAVALQMPAQPETNFEPIQVREATIGRVKCLVVDARSLWNSLGVGRDFTTWIKARITQYGFVQGIDFDLPISFDSPEWGNQKGKHGGDKRSLDYLLTMDTAKELAMVERNDLGRQARRYFIDCERQLIAASTKTAGSNRVTVELDAGVLSDHGYALRSDVLPILTFSRACANQAWRLALRQYGPIYLNSRDAKASEAVACAMQARFLSQIMEEKNQLLIDSDLDDESVMEKLLADVELWSPNVG